MADTKRNALAELANEMSWIENILCAEGYGPYIADANKARRIIAELAKVRFFRTRNGTNYVRLAESAVALEKCREIAEEGKGK